LTEALNATDWCAHELADLRLGDARLDRRAVKVLPARWRNPEARFYARFATWGQAKAADALSAHERPEISLPNLLAPHAEATPARRAAEPLVLWPQDTTPLNDRGLRHTPGLGPIGAEGGGRGLFLHSLLALRPDGVPLGVLDAACWARPEEPSDDPRGRNAQSMDEKESVRWLAALQVGARVARRAPRTQVVVLADREGDLYELHDAVQVGPANLHVLIRAQHDRNLESHPKLWDFMRAQPVGRRRTLQVPRRRGQPARTARVELRWAPVTIQAPAVGPQKGGPPLTRWAIWVHEPHPPKGAEPLDWMRLSDLPVRPGQDAWEKVQWHCRRWGIAQWRRVLKSGCGAERREFETPEHLQRALAFELILAWRILLRVKLGREVPPLRAEAVFTPDELAGLWRGVKKKAPVRCPA
jgi:hypothetical protein